MAPRIPSSHGTPLKWSPTRGVRHPGDCYTYNRRTPWACITLDQGCVLGTEVVDVIFAGGQLKSSGKNGMVYTLDRSVTITSEYAIILELKNELSSLFTELH